MQKGQSGSKAFVLSLASFREVTSPIKKSTNLKMDDLFSEENGTYGVLYVCMY